MNINIKEFQGFEFLFDKDDTLIGILDDGSVLRYELQKELEKRFTNDELLDYINYGDNNGVYSTLFNKWIEEFQYFIS